jgi:type II secretory pathway pseudopilin PulG
MRQNNRFRFGFTLIEVLIFLGVFAMVVSVVLPLLFSTTETRLRQQTISLVEDNAAQAVQNLMRRVRNSERILSPVAGSTGSVLVLQNASGSLNPIIFGVQTGSLVVIERDVRWEVTSSQVAFLDFVVRNTSTSANRNSVDYSFRISRTIRLEQPHTYDRWFHGAATIHPDDTPQGGSCGCPASYCTNGVYDMYSWYICTNQLCYLRSDHVGCP